MWVWSDDLVERLGPPGTVDPGYVPLIAYAVAPDEDLDELALQLLSPARARERTAMPDGRRAHR
ncbi:MAG: hypothetical protein ABFR89_02015 [Actinomycetota bacterium]